MNTEHMFDEQMIRVVKPEHFPNRTYAAEWMCFGRSVASETYPAKPISLMEARQIAYGLGIHDVRIIKTPRNKNRRSTYQYSTKTIRLSPQHGVYILLHELAHHMAQGERGHTKRFRGQYLRLVRAELGDEWADRLRRSFILMGLGYDFSSPKKKAE
jgi:hypothetical protein